MKPNIFIKATDKCSTIHESIPAPILRKSFTLDFVPEHALLSISASGFYDLYINGQLIVDAKLLSARHIRECSFRGCRSLKTVVLSNTVTSIEERAFRCCPQLTSIRIPDSVTFIDKSNGFLNLLLLDAKLCGQSL